MDTNQAKAQWRALKNGRIADLRSLWQYRLAPTFVLSLGYFPPHRQHRGYFALRLHTELVQEEIRFLTEDYRNHYPRVEYWLWIGGSRHGRGLAGNDLKLLQNFWAEWIDNGVTYPIWADQTSVQVEA